MADRVGTELTAGPHLMAHYRTDLDRQGILSADEVARRFDGSAVKTAGVVIVRQRPGTAKGFVFLSLEDETCIVQAILVVGSPGLVVEGRLQKTDGTLSVKAEKFWRLPELSVSSGVPELPSHDFR